MNENQNEFKNEFKNENRNEAQNNKILIQTYPCEMIQDLLPLYHDGVCSKESEKIIKAHLSKCDACKQSYAALYETDKLSSIAPPDAEEELKKAASFLSVKKRMKKKQILITIAVVATVLTLLCTSIFAVMLALENDEDKVSYKDNIFVEMTEDGLIVKLQGSRASNVHIKRVESVTENGTKIYLFFCMSNTKWDELTTNDDVFNEHVLCFGYMGAGQVDRVYYYTGDYNGIESLDEDELQKVIDASILLWEKE